MQIFTDIASKLNRFGQCVCKLDNSSLRTDRRTTDNSGFKKLAVQWLNQVQYFKQTFVQVAGFVLRNRQLLKPAKRRCETHLRQRNFQLKDS